VYIASGRNNVTECTSTKMCIVGGESSHCFLANVEHEWHRTFTPTRIRGSRYHHRSKVAGDSWRDCSRDEESALLPTGSWLVENLNEVIDLCGHSVGCGVHSLRGH